MNPEELSVTPVELRDLPWISALMQKIVDISYSHCASREQIETIIANHCNQEALVKEIRAGSKFVKLTVNEEISGFASYLASDANPGEAYIDKLYVLPGELEQFTLSTLVNYIKEQARQAGYGLLSLSLPAAEQQKLEMLIRLGFNIRDAKNVEIMHGFQLEGYLLSTPLRLQTEL